MVLPALLLLVVTLVLVVLWVRRPHRPRQFPPGPPTFLIFGNFRESIDSIRGNFRQMVLKNKKKYGDIFSIVLPDGNRIVHLLTFDLIKEACAKADFSGRPVIYAFLLRTYNKKVGVIINDGPTWVEHRHFALRHLRDLGFGKSPMEDIIHEEFEQLSKEMTHDIDKPMKANYRFNLSVLNILWQLVASVRLERGDPISERYVKHVAELNDAVGPKSPIIAAPWTRHIAPEWSGYSAIVRHREETVSMMQKLIQEHRQTLDRDNPRDLIDHFLLAMEEPDAAERAYNEPSLITMGMDFFVAGMETTSTSLSWTLLFMVMYPDVQARVQREIDSVLADGRRVAYADRLKMPYTEAVVMETMRRATAVPQAVPHGVTTDTTLAGYRITKGTQVLMHLEGVHMDAEYWGDPREFRPDRFINEDGSVRRDERFIPFGIGKRFCLGENLAKMEMFMLFTSLMQRFCFAAVENQKLSLDTNFSIVQRPMEFYVTYKLRD